MLTKKDIQNFINKQNYNLKDYSKKVKSRWIDQKCTFDVVNIIADCILNFSQNNPQKDSFTTKDIWFSDYAINTVEAVYKKPKPNSAKARHEYDKFFQQPMEILAYAGILEKNKKGKYNIYKIAEPTLLNYIAISEKNTLYFIYLYLEKFISDNNLKSVFDLFFQNQDRKAYEKLRKTFIKFLLDNTKIKNLKECGRIFTKVINPLAYFKNKLGSTNGKISKHLITLDMLIYNRANFRDRYIGKPKNITRKEYLNQIERKKDKNYYKYQSTKAKNFLRSYNERFRDNKSEYNDDFAIGDKIEIHHIFPESQYPEISYYMENLIAINASQHVEKAHTGNKEIIETYQHLLLLAKTDIIEENLTNDETEKIYEFSKLLYVLNVGFENDNILEIEDMNFEDVVNAINLHYDA